MAISKPSITEIKNNNLHYTVLPSQILQRIAEKYGADTLAVWTFALNQAENFVIRARHIEKVLQISEKRRRQAFANLAELGLAVLGTGGRTKDGRIIGKAWHVSGLPAEVDNLLKKFIDHHTDPADSEESAEKGEAPVHPGPSEERTDPAENRQSDNMAPITIPENKNKTISEVETKTEFAQKEFARAYAAYPKKRDKFRAVKAWNACIQGLNREEITAFTDRVINNVNARIKAGEFSDLEFVPYFKTYLSGKLYEEIIHTGFDPIAAGIAQGQTVDEIFNQDLQPDAPRLVEFDDDLAAFESDMADFDAWQAKKRHTEGEK